MFRIWTGIILLFGIPVAGISAHDDFDGAAEQQERQEFLTTTVSEFTIHTGIEGSAQPRLGEQAALSYTNPVRSSRTDGAIYFWLQGKRPVAAAAVSIRAGGKVMREFATLSDESLQMKKRGDQVVWAPKKRDAFPLQPAPAVGASPPLRLTQMRALARRFTVSLAKGNPVFARLMPQPIHRNDDADSGLLDGAVFVFAEGTDPEILLVIEATQSSEQDQAKWQFSVARMTSVKVDVRVPSAAEHRRVDDAIRGLAPRLPGAELDVVFHGEQLQDAREILFYTPGLRTANPELQCMGFRVESGDQGERSSGQDYICPLPER
jgi:hypothetical protein